MKTTDEKPFEPTGPLRILKVDVENFMRLQSAHVELDRNWVVLKGKNEQGKSSLLKFIRGTLGGGRQVPDDPVHGGAHHAEGMIDLGELTVESRIDRAGKITVIVRDKDGAKQSAPMEILKKLYNLLAFSPIEFEKADKLEQEKILRRLLNLDFTELNKQHAKLYDERTTVGQRLDAAFGRLNTYPIACLTAPDAEVSVADLVSDKERAEDHNRNRDAVIKTDSEAAAECKRLHEELASARARRVETEKAVADLKPAIDTAAITEKIRTAESVNASVRSKIERLKAKKSVDEFEKQKAVLTLQIAEIDKEKARLTAAAPWPIPELAFAEEGGVLYKGHPFSQASKAARIRCSCAIVAGLHPQLKAILIEDAECVDEDGTEVVKAFALENDLQIIWEVIHSEEPGAIVFVDGVAESYNTDV
jgi:predicted ATP-dependent endonuclease of OLD family